jgi:hypothetical protein
MQALSVTGADAIPPALQGLLWLDRYGYYRQQPITGTLRLKNRGPADVRGKLALELHAGRQQVAAEELPLWQDVAEAGDTQDLPFALPHTLEEGLYELQAVFIPDPAAGAPPQKLDSVAFASLGDTPLEPLRGSNFRHYDQPLTLMIGYVHDEDTLRRDFADMRRRGYDIVCLEWFWRMLESQRGQYTFEDLDKAIDLAGQDGLKYMMYIGFWSGNPDWIPTVSGDLAKAQEEQFDLSDPLATEAVVQLYGKLAERLRDNDTVIGYVIRLHYPFSVVGRTAASRRAWAQFLAANGYAKPADTLALYGDRAQAEVFDGAGGVCFPERERYGNSPQTAVLWHLALRFAEEQLLAVTEACCREIRKYDPVKPIRLNLAQSYEPACDETSGFRQIGFYRLAEQYGGTINQECFEYPTHASREPSLARHYGVPLTTEGGDVPPGRATIARLYAHAIENDVAYVAYCHWLVRTQLFEWFRYKPFWKIRKRYTRVYDNLVLTSFWNDSWVGSQDWPRFFRHHHLLNEALAFNHWEFDVVNEDLLARGTVNAGQVLLDTNSFCLPEATCREIMRFVENGGTFVANWLTGYNRLDGQPPYLLFRRYAQVDVTEDVAGSVSYGTRMLGERSGLALSVRPDDAVLARWSDQRPAALCRNVGKGRFVLIGFALAPEDCSGGGVLEEILGSVGVRHRINSEADEAGLATSAAGGFFVTLLNNRPEPRTVLTRLHQVPAGQSYVVKDLLQHGQQRVQASAEGILEFRLPIEGEACAFAEILPTEP